MQGAVDAAADVAARLLPALRDRLAGLAGLLRLAEPPGPLDPFGMDPTLLDRAAPLLDFLYLTWWRVEATGTARVPAEGPAMVVANHGGTAPWDALVLRLALRRDHPARREIRPLLDEVALGPPWLRRLALRLGAVPATPENALRILGEGGAVAVFPQGGAVRPWPLRYRIGAFGRGGFAKVALRAGAAVVPCGIVGSEEASPPVGRAGFLADALHLPLLAAAPALPFGPLGGLPLPARWSLRFGEPADLATRGSGAAPDAEVVAGLAAGVRDCIQALVDEGLAARGSIYL
ncbi:MAG TPA: lysophospholipid acyltransferase family protein [Anaeromyxobacteraceae bacterium]